MTTHDREWRDISPFRYSLEVQASKTVDDYRYAPEKDPSMVLVRWLLCATALAGVIMFALPIIIKATTVHLTDRPAAIIIGGELKTRYKVSNFPSRKRNHRNCFGGVSLELGFVNQRISKLRPQLMIYLGHILMITASKVAFLTSREYREVCY